MCKAAAVFQPKMLVVSRILAFYIYRAFVVTLVMLLRLINCRFIIIRPIINSAKPKSDEISFQPSGIKKNIRLGSILDV